MDGDACIGHPFGAPAIIEQAGALAAFAGKAEPLRHGIDEKLLGLEDDPVLVRIERHDPLDRAIGMLDPERPQRACGKDLEGLAVEQRAARIVRLVIEIVTERFEARLQILLRERAADLQAHAQARQARRRRQSLHHGFRRRDEKERLLGFRDAPQDGGSTSCKLVRRLELIERQGVQARKHQDLAGGVERVNDAAEPLRPVLVLGEKNDSAAPGLFPLRKQMQGQHPER